MAGSERQAELAAGTKTRIQNVTGAQTIKATPALLHRLVIANADVAVQTVTVLDGATTLVVIQVPTKDTRSVEIMAQFATSLILTPSSANLDVLALYD